MLIEHPQRDDFLQDVHLWLLVVEQTDQLLVVDFVHRSQLLVEADDIGLHELALHVRLGGVLVAYAVLEHEAEGEDSYALEARYQFVVEVVLSSRDFIFKVVLVEFRLGAFDVLQVSPPEHPEVDAVAARLQHLERIVYAHDLNTHVLVAQQERTLNV